MSLKKKKMKRKKSEKNTLELLGANVKFHTASSEVQV